MKLLEIGKIVRVHGIKGAVKVICYVDEGMTEFKHIYLTNKKIDANITSARPLTGDAFVVTIDVLKDIDTAERFKNQSIYIDRDEYDEFENKLYMSDLIGKDVVNEKNEKIGELLDYDDYGASIILTIKCGVNSYSIPFVEEIIVFDEDDDVFKINQKTFEDLRV
ncbi:MAG: 16S rRNA processing protein RimM [Clostridiales bacterium]|nr:16S rRNA processing protein RimM [Clostridiales bacterium]